MKSVIKISLLVILLFTITGSTLYISDKTKTRISKKKEAFIKKQKELDKHYSDKQFGAIVENGKTVFRLFTPNAEKVSLIIFNKAEDTAGKQYNMLKDENAVWETELDGELYGKYYGFSVKHKGKDAVLCLDPYAKAVASLNTYFTPRKVLKVRSVCMMAAGAGAVAPAACALYCLYSSPPMFRRRSCRAISSTASRLTARIASSWEPFPLCRPVLTSIAIIASVSSRTICPPEFRLTFR
ncbi:MAG: hypothetical protein R6W68_12255, partial [Ignavibacteriaceae bacterium]